jgi:hypothetical protein
MLCKNNALNKFRNQANYLVNISKLCTCWCFGVLVVSFCSKLRSWSWTYYKTYEWHDIKPILTTIKSWKKCNLTLLFAKLQSLPLFFYFFLPYNLRKPMKKINSYVSPRDCVIIKITKSTYDHAHGRMILTTKTTYYSIVDVLVLLTCVWKSIKIKNWHCQVNTWGAPSKFASTLVLVGLSLGVMQIVAWLLSTSVFI